MIGKINRSDSDSVTDRFLASFATNRFLAHNTVVISELTLNFKVRSRVSFENVGKEDELETEKKKTS